MKLNEAKLLFLDLQTTGASPATGEPLEIAWMLASSNGGVWSTKSFLIKQPDDKPVPPRIQFLTGITDSDMQRAVSSDSVCTLLLEDYAKADAPTFIVHYARFERPFLSSMLSDYQITWEALCTHEIATRLFPNLPSRGIRGLSGYFGSPLDDCKRAETHAEATYQIWTHLCRILEESSISTLEELRTWLAQTTRAKRTAYEYPIERNLRLSLPDCPGIYKMLSRRGDVLYVGKATSLKHRVNSYFRGRKNRDTRKLEMLTQTWDIQVQPCATVLEACLLEVQEIKRLTPPYNIAMNGIPRPIVFYSREFDSISTEQDALHPIGPFRNEFVIDSFVRLLSSLREGIWDKLIFFDELPDALIADGFNELCRRHLLQQRHLENPRSLLALGGWIYRRQADLDEDVDEESTTAETDNSGENLDLTPEEVGDKFERLLARAYSGFVLAKRLTFLLNAKVEFTENGVNGILSFSADIANPRFPWKGFDLDRFDLLRVLDSELKRLRGQGELVRLETCVDDIVQPHAVSQSVITTA